MCFRSPGKGTRSEDLQAQNVMTRTIEHSRKHGPFDPRWPTLRSLTETDQPDDAWPAAITRAAVEAWEGEGGAVYREARRTNTTTRGRLHPKQQSRHLRRLHQAAGQGFEP